MNEVLGSGGSVLLNPGGVQVGWQSQQSLN